MNGTLRLGLLSVGLLIAAALLALAWTPMDAAAIDVAHRLASPSGAHLLGSDQIGRDTLSMLLAGAPVSLAVSLLAVGFAMMAGVPLGLAAAMAGGAVDEAIARASDLVFAFPSLLVAVLLAAWLGPGAINAVLAITIFNVPVFARVARAAARPLVVLDFVAAARVAGAGPVMIAVRHLLPNILPGLLAQASIQMSLALIAEAGLSFVGLGVQPPTPSWGRMLADAQTLLDTAPRLALIPGGAIVLAVLGFTLVGDGLAGRRRP